MSKKERREKDQQQHAGDDRRAGADRRRFERVLVDMVVDYRAEDTFLFAYITDISAMGIFVKTNEPAKVGTRLNLRFLVPGQKEPFELEGEVTWVNPLRPGDLDNLNPGMGVRFVDLRPADRERLTELVKTFAYLHDDRDDEASGDDDGEDTQVHGDADERATAALDDETLDDDDDDLTTLVAGRRPGRA